MIQSIRHQGLARFALTGDVSGVSVTHTAKLNLILTQLSFSAGNTEAFRQISGFHSVKRKFRGEAAETFAVKINKSWRLTFKNINGVINDLDYCQYH